MKKTSTKYPHCIAYESSEREKGCIVFNDKVLFLNLVLFTKSPYTDGNKTFVGLKISTYLIKAYSVPGPLLKC